MRQLHLCGADQEAQRSFGLMRPTYVLKIAARDINRSGLLGLACYEDDLGRYEADFLLVGDVPVVVQRYLHKPDEYTIFVDDRQAAAKALRPFHVSDELLRQLQIGRAAIVWTNDRLHEPLEPA